MEMDMQSPSISNVAVRPPGSGFHRFIVRISLVMIFTILASAGFLYLMAVNQYPIVFVIPSMIAVITGLVSGLFCRILFSGSYRFVRWLIVFLVIPTTLAVTGLASRQFLRYDFSAVSNIAFQPDFAILSGMGLITAFLIIFAWPQKKQLAEAVDRNSTVALQEPVLPNITDIRYNTQSTTVRGSNRGQVGSRALSRAPVHRKSRRKSGLQRWMRNVGTDLSRTKLSIQRKIIRPLVKNIRIALSQRPNPRTNQNRPIGRTGQIETTILSPQRLPHKRTSRRLRGGIRLVGKEESRCPYCLQVVKPRDPHGVVTCPICKSAHHKECWDITGSCQVPHSHTVL
jgi:hypothetical protein